MSAPHPPEHPGPAPDPAPAPADAVPAAAAPADVAPAAPAAPAGPASPAPADRAPGYPGRAEPPPVPSGPGVRPPFAAPPTERDRRRLWIGIGVGVLALLLCCGAGVAGFAALSVAGSNQLRQEAGDTVDAYLTALRDQDWGTAYSLTCTRRRSTQSLEEFVTEQRDQPRVTSWTLGTVEFSGSATIQPAAVRYADGTGATIRFRLVGDGGTADLKVCGTGQ